MADDVALSVAVVEDDRGTREGLAALIGTVPHTPLGRAVEDALREQFQR